MMANTPSLNASTRPVSFSMTSPLPFPDAGTAGRAYGESGFTRSPRTRYPDFRSQPPNPAVWRQIRPSRTTSVPNACSGSPLRFMIAR